MGGEIEDVCRGEAFGRFGSRTLGGKGRLYDMSESHDIGKDVCGWRGRGPKEAVGRRMRIDYFVFCESFRVQAQHIKVHVLVLSRVDRVIIIVRS